MDPKELKSLLKRAGLSVTEFAKIMDVSRPTASLWVGGTHKPHMLLAARFAIATLAIQNYVDAGMLPLKLSARDPAREPQLREMFAGLDR